MKILIYFSLFCSFTVFGTQGFLFSNYSDEFNPLLSHPESHVAGCVSAISGHVHRFKGICSVEKENMYSLKLHSNTRFMDYNLSSLFYKSIVEKSIRAYLDGEFDDN